MEGLRRRGTLLAVVAALALSGAACGVGGEAQTATTTGAERNADATAVTNAGSPAGTGDAPAGASELTRSAGDAASELDRRIARTLSDLDAQQRGADTVIALPDTVLFDFDRYVLRPEAGATLDRLAEAIIHAEGAPVRVEGHTDAVGGDAYNQTLSERRVQAVVGGLVAAGVQPARITAQGFGESRPVAANDTDEGRARNRRVEIVLVGVDLTQLSR